MKTLHSLADLSTYGVGILTGEACHYGLRILCDLTENGRDLVAAFMGAPEMDCFEENWNTSIAGVRAVSSVMLTRHTLADLCVFAMFFVEKADVVLVRGDSVMGLQCTHEYYDRYMAIVNEPNSGYTVYRKAAQAHRDGRNLHTMTGRTL